MNAREAKRQVMLVEWKERVISCRSSGQTVQEWCKGQGINAKTYYNWERRVLHAASEQLAVREQAPQFAELPTTASAESGNRLTAKISIGTATAELYEGVGAEFAAAICRALSHAE